MVMDWSEKRERGRIDTVQSLMLRKSSLPEEAHKAFSVDVSEENIGFQTEAQLSIGEYIRLEMVTKTKIVGVEAVVVRQHENQYGCMFVEEDKVKVHSFLSLTGRRRHK